MLDLVLSVALFLALPVPVDAFGSLETRPNSHYYEPHDTTFSPKEEIHDAAEIYGVNEKLMLQIAKVESDFNPKEQTGKYKGLFQLSDEEFHKYGEGNIFDSRDNARAAANMFRQQSWQYQDAMGHSPNFEEAYMIHQQGIQGAEEHYAHPYQPAWKSMCQTDEGKQRGPGWCRKAVWGNMLPVWKDIFKTVDNVLSGVFTNLWGMRIDGIPSNVWGSVAPVQHTKAHPRSKESSHRRKRNAK